MINSPRQRRAKSTCEAFTFQLRLSAKEPAASAVPLMISLQLVQVWKRFGGLFLHARKRHALLTAVLVYACSAAAASAGEATLVWSNGDSLTGTLVASDGKALTWRSTLFADPLQIDLSSLAAVIYSKNEPIKTPDSEFCILTRNSDVLRGSVKSIDENTITFEGARFGTIQLERTQIVSLQRSANYGLIYMGPRGLDGWQQAAQRSSGNGAPVALQLFANPLGANKAPPAKSKTPSWSDSPDGSLHTVRPDGDLILPQPLPAKFHVEVELRSKKTCSFAMAIGRNSKTGLRVETWVDVLVAVNNVKFKPLRNLTQDDHDLHLHAFVDFSANTMSVYSGTGEKLGEIDTYGAGGDGLTFRCLENDLTIRRLRISQWDGVSPQLVKRNQSRIHLANGKTHYGIIRQLNADSGLVVLREENADIDLPLMNIASIYFNTEDVSAVSDPNAAHITWSDGGFASGTLVSIADGAAIVATGYTHEPLRCNLTDVTRISLSGKVQPATDGADRLIHSGGALNGSLVVDGDSEAPLLWKPLGGLSASALTHSGDARFLRGANVEHFSGPPELWAAYPDVIYLVDNDVLPCRFEGCSETTIEFTSPFASVRSLPKQNVRAVELTATNRIHQSGFGAEGWKGITDKQKFVFRGNNQFSHPSILTGDTIRFRMSWPEQSFTNLIVSLYGKGEPSDADSTVITFSIMQNLIQLLDRPPPQQAQFIARGFGQANLENVVRVQKSAAEIQIVARDGNLFVSVDGKQVKTIKMKPGGAGSGALSFSGTSTGNRRVIINGRPQIEGAAGIEISQFEIDNSAGVSIRHFIEEESRLAALTIPRFRRDNPPTHILLAPNGDLLRGRLLAINNQQVTFESRLETLRLDRQRVAAIIWLQSDEKRVPSDSAADKSRESASPKTTSDGSKADVLARLANGFSIKMSPTRLVHGQLHGESALLGKCSFPATAIRELILGAANSDFIVAYDRWIAQHAKEPDWDIPQSDGGNSAAAAMIGHVADDFQLPMLDGTTFHLKDHSDKIVVLDFWATWCGPCVAALPEYIRATAAFDSKRVIFVAVNLQESSDQIRGFLLERNLAPRVALDRAGEISRKFQVSGIPHTVILGAGNVVENVHIGYQPGTGNALQTTIRQMLDGTWKRPEKTAN